MDPTMMHYADMADHAMQTGDLIPPINQICPACTVQNAYDIQLLNVQRAIQRGWQIGGYKLGATNAAAQASLKIDQPFFGTIYRHMILSDKAELYVTSLNSPLLEVEIAVTMKKDVTRPIHTLQEAYDHILSASLGFEIVSNRLSEPPGNATNLIADNSAARYIVVGKAYTDRSVIESLANEHVSLYGNGELLQQKDTSAVFSQPVKVIIWLANMLLAQGTCLRAGEVVLTGALTSIVPITSNCDFVAISETLGSLRVSFH